MVCSHPVLDALGHNTPYFPFFAQIPCSNLPLHRCIIPLPLRSILLSPKFEIKSRFLSTCREVIVPYIYPQLTPMSLLVLHNFVCPRRPRVVRAPRMLTSAFPLSFCQDSPATSDPHESCCNGVEWSAVPRLGWKSDCVWQCTFSMRTVSNGHLSSHLGSLLAHREETLDHGSQGTKQGPYELVCQHVEDFRPRRRGQFQHQAV